MENGFFNVNINKDVQEKYILENDKKKKENTFILIFSLILAIIIAGVTIAICIFTNNENKFGGYETAQQYVDSIITIKDVSPIKNDIISSWYGISISFINNNEEEIKYIWQEYTVYNSVGDYVKSEFDEVQFKATGPFIKGKKFIRVTEKDNYCKEKIVSAKISYLKIEFMSGETVNFNKEMLNYVNSNVEVV